MAEKPLVLAWVIAGASVLVLLYGCSSDEPARGFTSLRDGTPALSHAGIVTGTLTGRRILATPVLGDPRGMAIVGSELWIADRAGDPYLHVVDLRTDSLMVSRGRTGEGPGDFGEVPQLTIRPGDDRAVWAYDAGLRRLTRETSDSAPQYRVIKAFGDQVESAWSFQWQGRDRLVGIGDMDTNRIMLADSAGFLIKLVANALMGPDSVSLEARRGISSGYVMCVQPKVGRIAVLYLAGGQIDLYEASGEHRALADVPFPSDGDWALDQRGRVWFTTDWDYYAACSGSINFLYALFAGHRSDGPGGAFARQATHIHVFDWSGKLRAVWALDRALSTLVVSGDTIMYATGQDGDGVYEYRLPSISSSPARRRHQGQ